ncbi:DNA topology modulation protein [Candidatus Lokiarchaeum ossiferum]|uniref:DNA topology modulation protein n=1 Tax=Candidatus Lokiarchaeum ossiferum TaxID=2951803 RepID=UPI00352E7CFA
MKRIMIIGCAGSGKSTLAFNLGTTLKLPIYHLDKVFWKPNWVKISPEDWQQYISTIIQKESWIIDGNYSSTMEIRMRRANIIIYLDFPRFLCLWRVIKRRFQYNNKSRPDINDQCNEKLDLEFLQWIWNYPKRSKPKTMQLLKQCTKNHLIFHITKKKQLLNMQEQILNLNF